MLEIKVRELIEGKNKGSLLWCLLSLLVEKTLHPEEPLKLVSEAGTWLGTVLECYRWMLSPFLLGVTAQSTLSLRCLQGTLGVVPVMAQEMLSVSVLLYWSSASVCPAGCQMVGVLGLESLVLASQTGEAAWALIGRRLSPGARTLPCRSCGAAVVQR